MAKKAVKKTAKKSAKNAAKSVVKWRDPMGFAIIHRYVLGLETRAIDLYSTDEKTLELIELILADALQNLYRVKPKLTHSHAIGTVQCDDARYEPCVDVCVPKGCCNIDNGGDKKVAPGHDAH